MQGSGCSMVSPIIQPVHRVGSVVPAPSPALRVRAGVRADANGESKWGQIKIHEDPQFGARNALTKFCSDPFCAVCGEQGPPRSPSVTRTDPRSARLRVGRLKIHLRVYLLIK